MKTQESSAATKKSHPILSKVDGGESADMEEKSLEARDVDDDEDDDEVEVDMFAAAAAADPTGEGTKQFREDPILDRRPANLFRFEPFAALRYATHGARSWKSK